LISHIFFTPLYKLLGFYKKIKRHTITKTKKKPIVNQWVFLK